MRAGSIVVAVVALLAGPCGAREGVAGPEDPLAEASAGAAPSVEDFAWMVGHWRGEGFGGVCEEVWTGPLGGSMVGLFRLVQEDQLAFSEHMMLVEEPDDGVDPLLRKPQPDDPVPGKRDLGGRPRVAREVLVEPREGLWLGGKQRGRSQALPRH